MSKQQRERFTERSRPTRKVVGEEVAEAPASSLRNPIVAIASATLALTLVLGMWSFFTAEPVPEAPAAPAIDGLPEGLDLEGLDLGAPPVEVIDGEEGAEDEDAAADESESDEAESDVDAAEDDAEADEAGTEAEDDASEAEPSEADEESTEDEEGGEAAGEAAPADEESTSEDEDTTEEDGG